MKWFKSILVMTAILAAGSLAYMGCESNEVKSCNKDASKTCCCAKTCAADGKCQCKCDTCTKGDCKDCKCTCKDCKCCNPNAACDKSKCAVTASDAAKCKKSACETKKCGASKPACGTTAPAPGCCK